MRSEGPYIRSCKFRGEGEQQIWPQRVNSQYIFQLKKAQLYIKRLITKYELIYNFLVLLNYNLSRFWQTDIFLMIDCYWPQVFNLKNLWTKFPWSCKYNNCASTVYYWIYDENTTFLPQAHFEGEKSTHEEEFKQG